MSTQLVIVKCFGNVPKVNKIVYSLEKTVFVTSATEFEAIKSGQSNLFPIGFRREDVFEYRGEDISKELDWKTLKPWSGGVDLR